MKKARGQLHRLLDSAAAYKLAAFLILLGFLAGAYNANQSYAWFTDQENVPLTLESGKVHYEVAYIAPGGLMTPGKNLFTSFTVTNKSTIDTNVRLKIEYTVWSRSAGSPPAVTSAAAVYTTNGAMSSPDDDQYLNLNIKKPIGSEPGFELMEIPGALPEMGGSWWVYSALVPAVSKDAAGNIIPAVIPVFDASADPPFQFYYDGPKTKNVFESRPITITIHLQAKQADHVEWADLTVIETFDGI